MPWAVCGPSAPTSRNRTQPRCIYPRLRDSGRPRHYGGSRRSSDRRIDGLSGHARPPRHASDHAGISPSAWPGTAGDKGATYVEVQSRAATPLLEERPPSRRSMDGDDPISDECTGRVRSATTGSRPEPVLWTGDRGRQMCALRLGPSSVLRSGMGHLRPAPSRYRPTP